jgi:cation diffusion facilitator CzcD-associated flavoprotein CzcO
VAVIGTGSSSAQFVPAIQPRVGRLLIFQRTPAWIGFKLNRRTTRLERRLYRIPIVERLARNALFTIYEGLVVAMRRPRLMRWVGRGLWLQAVVQVRDRELRRKLRPNYQAGCKRLVRSTDFYPAVTKPNVDVITEGIREIREHSILTDDGVEHEVDTIVFATGFYMTDPPIREKMRGRGGLRMLDVFEREGTRALRGTTISQFPNYFFVVGPNTGTGNNALIVNMESQIHYILECLRTMDSRGVVAVEPRPEAVDAWDEYIRGLLRGTVWQAGCTSHYVDHTGRNVVLWPDFLRRFREHTRHFDPAEYILRTENGREREGEQKRERVGPA